jgi:hypothetical protein
LAPGCDCLKQAVNDYVVDVGKVGFPFLGVFMCPGKQKIRKNYENIRIYSAEFNHLYGKIMITL